MNVQNRDIGSHEAKEEDEKTTLEAKRQQHNHNTKSLFIGNDACPKNLCSWAHDVSEWVSEYCSKVLIWERNGIDWLHIVHKYIYEKQSLALLPIRSLRRWTLLQKSKSWRGIESLAYRTAKSKRTKIPLNWFSIQIDDVNRFHFVSIRFDPIYSVRLDAWTARIEHEKKNKTNKYFQQNKIILKKCIMQWFVCDALILNDKMFDLCVIIIL